MKILFGIVDGSSEAKGVAPLPIIALLLVVALVEVIAHFSGMADPTFFDTTTKEE